MTSEATAIGLAKGCLRDPGPEFGLPKAFLNLSLLISEMEVMTPPPPRSQSSISPPKTGSMLQRLSDLQTSQLADLGLVPRQIHISPNPEDLRLLSHFTRMRSFHGLSSTEVRVPGTSMTASPGCDHGSVTLQLCGLGDVARLL